MKKTLLLLPLILCSCSNQKIYSFKVNNYYNSFHFVERLPLYRVAEFNDNAKKKSYVIVPFDYHKNRVSVYYVGCEHYFNIALDNGANEIVCCNGWELKQ